MDESLKPSAVSPAVLSASPPSVLVVEDEPKIAALLCDYLVAAGFVTSHVDHGTGLVQALQKGEYNPDVILLDVMLPGKDGLSICREVRDFSTVPIIMLTARVEEIDRLLGLELGADDYVCKPFSPREVVARVKAVVRRAAAKQSGHESVAAIPISLDAQRFTATVNRKSLDLTPVEFRLLNTLAGQPGRVFSRDQLMDVLYADHRVVSDRTVDSHVKNVRRKLVQAGGDETWLRSIYGVGYKLEW
ncbi:MAG: response regulator [Rhodocyclaceae bacterium]|nr:response regulator [Rhodocyclaceae bacterium]